MEMEEFLDNSRRTLKRIAELGSIVKEMEESIRMKQTSVLTEDKETVLDHKMDELDEKFDKLCHEIKGAISDTQAETKKLEKEQEISKEEADMRGVHVHKYLKELSDAVLAYRNLKSEFKNKEKDLLKQAYQIVHPKVTDDELDKLAEGNDMDDKLSGAFSTGTASGQQMYNRAKERGRRIGMIVKDVNKLVALINELADLVGSNTKIVDEIVVHVTKAEMNTRQANRELEEALEYQRKINFIKRMIFLIIGILFIIALGFLIGGPLKMLLAGGLIEEEVKRNSGN